MTIRQRLFGALLLALLPILALAIVQAALTYNRQAEERRERLISVASAATQRAQLRIRGAQVILEALGPASTGLACGPMLGHVQTGLPDYEALVRYNRLGRVMCASGAVPAGDRRQELWFRRLETGAPRVITSAEVPNPARGAGIFTAVPVRTADGAFDGAEVAVFRLTSLRAEPGGLPPGTSVGLLDDQGEWIGPPPAGASPPPPGWRARAARSAVLWNIDTPQGSRQQVLTALAPDVFAVLSAPDPGFFAAAWADPAAILLLPLLAWGLAFASVWLVADRIVLRWLLYLDRIAGLYARGRFSVRPVQAEAAPEEIRHLARTLDEMAETIVGRDHALRESLGEKDVLMREIHHRVKNNLQIITSLLNMQQRALIDPAARAALSDTRQRITALAIIYRALYQSEDLKRVDVRLFLSELLGQLMTAETRREQPIQAELEAESLIIDPDKLAPFALFAVEAITNAQKHAFPGRGGRIDVRFEVDGDFAVLDVTDDGVGACEDPTGAGVGRTLMTAFARQLRGSAEIGAGPEGRGTSARLMFPVTPLGNLH